MENNFGNLEKIVIDFLQEVIATKIIDLSSLLKQMKAEFVRLGYHEPTRQGVENILISRLDNVGDFILTIPAIREIRMNYPSAFITLVVRKGVYPVAELCPYVNEVLIFDEESISSNVLEIIINATDFAKNFLWRRSYDLAFNFRYWNDIWRLNTLFMMYFSGAPQRISYIGETIDVPQKLNLTNMLLTDLFTIPKEFNHDVARNLYLIKAFGLTVRNTNLEFWYNKTDLYRAKNLLGNFGEGRIKIAAGIGASGAPRKYPIEKYLVAFKEIIAKGASLVLFGGPSEIDDAKFLEENLPREFIKNVVELKPSWRITTAIISQLDMYVGNDTGTQHISSALKKPVIILSRVAKDFKNFFSKATETQIYYPYQTNSIVIQPEHQLEACRANPYFYGCKMSTSHCIAQIEPAEIVDAYVKMVSFIRQDVKFFDGDFEKFLEK